MHNKMNTVHRVITDGDRMMHGAGVHKPGGKEGARDGIVGSAW
jgi:hypothetical protein